MAEEKPTNEQLADVFADVCAIVEAKEQAYGGSWKKRGWRGNLARILSKSDRLENLLWRKEALSGEDVSSDESVHDTAMDMMALLAMFVINYDNRNEWGPNSSGSRSSEESGAGA